VIARCHPTSAQRNRRRRIALGWFCNDIFLWESGQQFANCGFLFGVCQNQNTFTWNEAINPRHGFFEKGSLRDKMKQLLRPGSATATVSLLRENQVLLLTCTLTMSA